jgi:hypothetical protein
MTNNNEWVILDNAFYYPKVGDTWIFSDDSKIKTWICIKLTKKKSIWKNEQTDEMIKGPLEYKSEEIKNYFIDK